MTKRLDRKISVDVSGMTIEQKKRVQDCFFKLGYAWGSGGKTHRHLDAKEYTNTCRDGVLRYNRLLYSSFGNFPVPPITLEELEKITAEFTGENNM